MSIQSRERCNSSNNSQLHPKTEWYKQRPGQAPYSKLNQYLFILTILSSLAVLISVAFISFLWFSWDNNRTMRMLARHNWTTRAITLTSLLLRSATFFQATLASSMLASLSLERTEVPLMNLPIIATMRTNSSGPFALAWYINSGLFQNFRCDHRMLVPFLAVLLSLSTFAFQFTSTVLLSDISTGFVTGYVKSFPIFR